MRPARPLLLILLFSALLQPANAHNGDVAIAVPLEGIVVDGALADWPAHLTAYPMELAYVDPDTSPASSLPTLRVAFAPVSNATYLAIAVDSLSGQMSCSVMLRRHAGDGRGPEEDHDDLSIELGPDSLTASFSGTTVEVGFDTVSRISVHGFEIVVARRCQPGFCGFEFQVQSSDDGLSSARTMALAAGLVIGESWYSWGDQGWSHGDLLLPRGDDGEQNTLETLAGTLVTEAFSDAARRIWIFGGYQWGTAGAIAVLALLHVLLFAFAGNREHLEFAAFATSLGVMIFILLHDHAAIGLDGYYRYLVMMLTISAPQAAIVSGHRLVYAVLGRSIPRLLRHTYTLLAICFVANTLAAWFLTGPDRRDDGPLVSAFIVLVVSVYCLILDILRVLYVGLRRRLPGARLLALGLCALLVALVAGIVTNRPEFLFYGTAVLVLAVSGSLARKFAHAERQSRQVLERELETARAMQMALMPTSPPRITGFSVAGSCRTANHVGGDLFGYFSLESGLSIANADVTGHAMEAAIPVVMFNGILDQRMEMDETMESRFEALNRSLCRSLGDHRFICLTMAEIDTDTKKLRLASCGSPYPLHVHNGEVTELEMDGYPLGVRPKTSYRAIEAQLSEGDYFIMYSDGIPETVNAAKEMFGYERTVETVREACAEEVSAADLLERLMTRAREFAGDEPQADDMTCVVVRVKQHV